MTLLPAARAASLAPEQADALEADALDAIGRVSEPEQAEALLARIKLAEQAIRLSELGRDYEQRWGRVRLLGERRYGELLGPPAPGTRTDLQPVTGGNGLSGAERKAMHDARQVAAVPEPAFTEYVETAPQPTRAGLLRAPHKLDVHTSSATPEWETPQQLFDVLDGEFGFELDVCASPGLEKCERFYSPNDDGLAQSWEGMCWMNPPYGEEIRQWVAKAHETARAGATVVALVPARVDTGWWWDHCRHHEVRFIRGRLKFGGADTGAPFPSAVVVFGAAPRVVWWEWR